jgi:DNA-binding GntR family transcriptional regulator
VKKVRAGRLKTHDAPEAEARLVLTASSSRIFVITNRRPVNSPYAAQLRPRTGALAMSSSTPATPLSATEHAAREAPRTPIHDRVYEVIRAGLVGGRFVPGRSVTLRGLAQMLGVSPMPVRAAVTRLVAEGALALTPTRRVLLPTMTIGRFEELVRARILLEGEAAERALPGIGFERLALIRSHDERLEACLAADDVAGYMEANHAFHFAIYRSVPSSVLVPLIESLWLQFGPFMRIVYEELDMTRLVDQHGRSMDAIARRDAAELRRAIETDIADGMSIIGKAALKEPAHRPL